MSIQFSANLAALRRDKGVTQKEAAQALGVSQALLSHYEKGIRECHLDFVKQAADYYGVTADYLLGMTESRQQVSELLSRDDISDDQRMIPKTVVRCLLSLAEQARNSGETAEMFFTDFFTLCVRKYLCAVRGGESLLGELCDVSLDRLCRNAPEAAEEEAETPLFTKTVSDHAMLLLNNDVSQAFR